MFHVQKLRRLWPLATVAVIAAGCSHSPAEKSITGGAVTTDTILKPSAQGEKLVLTSSPAEPMPVIQARESVKDGDEVAILGRIGGSVDPWVEGRAAFQIVDPSLMPCNENPGDGCTTPWDYCCDNDRLPKAMATVKFVGATGKTLETDARKLLGVKELQSVVVKGKAQRDEAGNLTVLASGLFLAKTAPPKSFDPHAGHKHDRDHDDDKPADTP